MLIFFSQSEMYQGKGTIGVVYRKYCLIGSFFLMGCQLNEWDVLWGREIDLHGQQRKDLGVVLAVVTGDLLVFKSRIN